MAAAGAVVLVLRLAGVVVVVLVTVVPQEAIGWAVVVVVLVAVVAGVVPVQVLPPLGLHRRITQQLLSRHQSHFGQKYRNENRTQRALWRYLRLGPFHLREHVDSVD